MEIFINKMRLFAILLFYKHLINRKSRIGNNLETSETLWSSLFFLCFKYLSYKGTKYFYYLDSFIFLYPHSTRYLIKGISSFPVSVRVYSTFGGT